MHVSDMSQYFIFIRFFIKLDTDAEDNMQLYYNLLCLARIYAFMLIIEKDKKWINHRMD